MATRDDARVAAAGARRVAADRPRSHPGAAMPLPVARPETGARTCDGARARTAHGVARRTDRGPHEAGAHADRLNLRLARDALPDVPAAGRARPRFRAADQLAHRRAASGAHRDGWR